MKLNRILAGLFFSALLSLPFTAQAQFTFITNNDAITITGYTGTDGNVVIPSMTNGWPVNAIGDGAFAQSTLTNIHIPDSVKIIGVSTFFYCTNLFSITIPNSITNIGAQAFGSCVMPSIRIPGSVTTIPPILFLFSGVTNVIIDKGVLNIGSSAFGFCSKLTGVTLPEGVTNIDGGAFNWCGSLTAITIPRSVLSISSNAFAICQKMTNIYFQSDAPMGDGSLFDLSFNTTVYYMPGTAGWGPTYRGAPTKLWNPHADTSDAGFGVRTNRFGFPISGTSNLIIVVEACTNLFNPSWQPVQTITLTNGSSYFSDLQWTNYPGRFYRFRSQ